MDDSEQEIPPGDDIFVMELGISPSYMIDDDDRPGEPTIILEVSEHAGSQPGDPPIRVHLAASAIPELAQAMTEVARQSELEVQDARRSAGS